MIGLWRRGWVCALALAAGLGLPLAARAQRKPIPFSDAAVENAIQRGKKYLWSLYRETGDPWPDKRWSIVDDGKGNKVRTPYENYGGRMSLAIYALLAAGERYTDPRMKRALEWLSRIDSKGTYTLGIRAQIWALLPREMGRELLKKDAARLIRSISQPAPARTPDPARLYHYGTYSYVSADKPSGGGDHSNTQFGILGVWAAARCNLEVPKWYWELVYRHWLLTQNTEGGWNYGIGLSTGSKDTMTAAGLASVMVAFDNLYVDKFVKCGGDTQEPTITRALNWFDRNFYRHGDYQKGPAYYYLYAVERVGLACGYKYFGEKDWYKLGAARLINGQSANGSWGGLIDTSFSMLFLVRGRSPVMVNRLEYEGDWNNRPRALANLTRWMGRTFEKEASWQIINLRTPVEEWHDAPILMISGSKRPKFTDQELGKLREFVHQGGMIFSLAECESQSQPFNSGMRRYYARLFPEYELKLLPEDHPIYGVHFKLRRPRRLWGISNGVRLLSLHTTDDLALPWQTNSYATASDAFQLAANVFLFVSDRGYGRPRGTSPWPKKAAFVPLRVARVARIRHNGNWNPEPLAWERFRLLMGRKWQTKLIVSEPMTLQQLKVADYRVAAMTGTTELALTDAEKEALKGYVASGGTLIVDAAGGAEKFADSATRLLVELFGEESLGRLLRRSPVYRLAGFEIESVQYRRAARALLGKLRYPRLLAVTVKGRPVVLFSKDDLTAGLVGYPCYTCVGYSPDSAVALMRNLVLYGIRIDKDGSEPAVKSASAG